MSTANQHHSRGESLYRDGKYAEAAAEYRLAIDAATAPGAAADPDLHRYLRGLARSLAPGGVNGDALAQHKAAFEQARRQLPASDVAVIRLQLDYSLALMKHGDPQQAQAQLGDAEQRLKTAKLESSIAAGILHTFVSDLGYLAGDADEALSRGQRALTIYLQAPAVPGNRIAEAHTSIGNAHMKRKDYAAAFAAYQAARACRVDDAAHDHYQIAVNEGSLAEALLGLSRCSEAKPHLDSAETLLADCAPDDVLSQHWIADVRRNCNGR